LGACVQPAAVRLLSAGTSGAVALPGTCTQDLLDGLRRPPGRRRRWRGEGRARGLSTASPASSSQQLPAATPADRDVRRRSETTLHGVLAVRGHVGQPVPTPPQLRCRGWCRVGEDRRRPASPVLPGAGVSRSSLPPSYEIVVIADVSPASRRVAAPCRSLLAAGEECCCEREVRAAQPRPSQWRDRRPASRSALSAPVRRMREQHPLRCGQVGVAIGRVCSGRPGSAGVRHGRWRSRR
jgi:hypothetical protein